VKLPTKYAENTTATMKKKRTRTHITDHMIKQMVDLEREGYTQVHIADLLGVAQATVNRNLKKARPINTHLTSDEKAKMIAMKKEGMTSKQVAAKLHRGLSTVDKVWAAYRKNNMVSSQIKQVIHRVGNELHNVDVRDKKRVTSEPPLITPPAAENDVPMVHPDKVETTNATLWLVITAVAFVLGLAVAGL
jgi:predicted transcriptional regulator